MVVKAAMSTSFFFACSFSEETYTKKKRNRLGWNLQKNITTVGAFVRTPPIKLFISLLFPFFLIRCHRRFKKRERELKLHCDSMQFGITHLLSPPPFVIVRSRAEKIRSIKKKNKELKELDLAGIETCASQRKDNSSINSTNNSNRYSNGNNSNS